MKKLTLSLAILPLLIFGACKDTSISEAECTPVVAAMFENFKTAMPEGEVDKAKLVLLPMLQKECQKGIYKLDCLQTAKTLPELQLCKK